jgi:hypothetical protein
MFLGYLLKMCRWDILLRHHHVFVIHWLEHLVDMLWWDGLLWRRVME